MLEGSEPARLLWPVQSILRVRGYDVGGQERTYREGADWVRTPTGLARAKGSAIPDFADYSYDRRSPCARGLFRRDCARSLLQRVRPGYRPIEPRDGAFWFASSPRNPPTIMHCTVYVDYEAETPDRPIAGRSRSPFSRIVCLGDSITAGAHTTAREFGDDDAESWPGLLRTFFQGRHEVLNVSEGGARVDGLEPLLAARTALTANDLLIFAPGMNDHIAGPAHLPAFRATVARIVDHAVRAGAAVLLVGFFEQNIRWVEEYAEDTAAFNAAIRDLAAERGIPFIDMRPDFARSVPDGRQIEHLTGDFMHHPNAYGQRLYFSAILPHLLTQDFRPSEIDAFVELPGSD